MIETHLSGGFDHTGVSGVIPLGLTAEVVSSSAIEAAWGNSTLKPHREHVTPYIYTNPEKFRLTSIPAPQALSGRAYRLTVDTEADYKLMKEIHARLTANNLPFNAVEAVRLLDANPGLCKMNMDVAQKDWRREA
jgi:spore coat polysaccharide biosynthesis protein SpsF